jgi:hypothetical protein
MTELQQFKEAQVLVTTPSKGKKGAVWVRLADYADYGDFSTSVYEILPVQSSDELWIILDSKGIPYKIINDDYTFEIEEGKELVGNSYWFLLELISSKKFQVLYTDQFFSDVLDALYKIDDLLSGEDIEELIETLLNESGGKYDMDYSEN